MKALFIVGQCLRLLHTDPWQEPTYKVLEVGQYSYYLEVVETHYGTGTILSNNVMLIKDQAEYQSTPCPGDKDHE